MNYTNQYWGKTMNNKYELNLDAWKRKGVLDNFEMTVEIYDTSKFSMTIASEIDSTFYLDYDQGNNVCIQMLDYDVTCQGHSRPCVYIDAEFGVHENKFTMTFGSTDREDPIDETLDIELPFDMTEEQYFQYSTVVDFPISYEYLCMWLKALRGIREVFYENLPEGV